MEKMKVILDTDIGDDIDDAFALSLLLSSPEVELLGVTTVFRNSAHRARMCKALIHSYGKEVEVHAGIDDTIKQKVEDLLSAEVKEKIRYDENGKYCIPQYEDSYKDNKYEGDDAVDFIISQIEKYPHEVILILIGPETNAAHVLMKRPDIAPLIKEIRIMGGAIGPEIPWAEWNIACDPEAAKIVYTSGVPLYAIGCNVTMKCPLSDENIALLKSVKSSGSDLLIKMLNSWLDHYTFTRPILHDPLAASTLFKDYVIFEDKKIEVFTEGKDRGYTRESENGNLIHIAVDLNHELDFISDLKQKVFR